MNEKAFNLAYDLFVSDGYKKDKETFKQLLSENEDAFNLSYSQFKREGYNRDKDHYAGLMGVQPSFFLPTNEESQTPQVQDQEPETQDQNQEPIGSVSSEQEPIAAQPVDSDVVESLSQSYSDSLAKEDDPVEKQKLSEEYRQALRDEGVDPDDDGTAFERGLVSFRDSKTLESEGTAILSQGPILTAVEAITGFSLFEGYRKGVKKTIDLIVGEEDVARIQAQQNLPTHLKYNFKDVNGKDQTALVNTLAKQAARMGAQVFQDVLKDIDNDPELLKRYKEAEENRRALMMTAPMTEEEEQADYERASKSIRTNEEIRQEYISEVFEGNSEDRIRKNIEALLPLDLKENTEFLEALSDKIYADYSVPTNLDGDGKYNARPLTEYFARQLDSGAFSLFSSVDYISDVVVNRVLHDSETRSKLNEEKRAEINQNLQELSKLNTQFTRGVSQSMLLGDVGNAVQQTLGGLTQTLPIMAVTMATAPIGGTPGLIAGAALTGTLSGVGTYVNIRDMKYTDPNNPEKELDAYTENEALMQSFIAGGGESLFSVVGGKIFQNASKAASMGQMIGVSRGSMKSFVKGAVKEYGVSFGEEALTEFTTELTNYIAESQIREGAEFNLTEALNQAMDAFWIGGFAGVGFKGPGDLISGNLNYNSYAAGALFDPANMEVYARIEAEKSLIKEKFETESDPKKRKILEDQLVALNSTKSQVRSSRSKFFDGLAVRSPNAMEEILELDQKILTAKAQLKQATADGDTELAKTYRRKVKAFGTKKINIIDKFTAWFDSTPLTSQEKTKIAKKKINDAFVDIDNKTSDIKESLEFHRRRHETLFKGTNMEAASLKKIQEFEADLDATNNKYRDLFEKSEKYLNSRAKFDSLSSKQKNKKLTKKEKQELQILASKIIADQIDLNGQDYGINFDSDVSALQIGDFNFEFAEQANMDEALNISTSVNMGKAIQAVMDGADSRGAEPTALETEEALPAAPPPTSDPAVDQEVVDTEPSAPAVDPTSVDTDSDTQVEDEALLEEFKAFKAGIIDVDDDVRIDAYINESVSNGKAKQYNTNADGSIGVEASGLLDGILLSDINKSVAGLAKTLNRTDLKVIVAVDPEMGDKFSQGISGYFDKNNGIIYIDPFQSDTEAELSSTIFEEIAHGAFDDIVLSMDIKGRTKLVNDLIDSISETKSGKDEIINGLEEKIRLYADALNQPLNSEAKTGKDFIIDNLGNNVFAKETVAEIFSTVDIDKMSESSLKSFIKAIRKVLSSVLPSNKVLNDRSQARSFVSAMKDIRAGQKADLKSTNESTGRSNSIQSSDPSTGRFDPGAKRLRDMMPDNDFMSPFDLPEGKFTVVYNKQQFKGGKFGGKVIGNYPVSMEFNGKQHFINWWKKTTFPKEMYGKRNVKGTDVGVAKSVRAEFSAHRIEVDGKRVYIDTDVLKDKFQSRTKEKKQFFVKFYKRRGPVSGARNNISADINKAFEDGLISTNLYNEFMTDLSAKSSWGINVDMRSESEPDILDSKDWVKSEYNDLLSSLEADRVRLNEALAKIAEKKGVDFNYEEGGDFYGDDSRKIKKISYGFAAKVAGKTTPSKRKQKKTELVNRMVMEGMPKLECTFPLNQASLRELCLEYITELYPDATPGQRLAHAALLEFKALNEAFKEGNQYVLANPVEFQKRSLEATEEYMNLIFEELDMPVSKNYLPMFRAIVAISSNGTDRVSNFEAAEEIFKSVLVQSKHNKPSIPKSTIKSLKKGRGVFANVNRGRVKTMSSHFHKLNQDIASATNEQGRFNGGAFSAKMQGNAKGVNKGKKYWTYAMDRYGGTSVGKLGAHFAVMMGGDANVIDLRFVNFVKKYTGDIMDYSEGSKHFNRGAARIRAVVKDLNLPNTNVGEMTDIELFNVAKEYKEYPNVSAEAKRAIKKAYSRFVRNEGTDSFDGFNELASEAVQHIESLGENHVEVKAMMESLDPQTREEMFYKTNTKGERVFHFPVHLLQSIAYAGEQAYTQRNQRNSMKGYTDDKLVLEHIKEKKQGGKSFSLVSREQSKLDMENEDIASAIYNYDISTVSPLEINNTDQLTVNPQEINTDGARDIRVINDVTFNPNPELLEKVRRFEEVSKDDIVAIDGEEGSIVEVPPSAVEVIMDPLLSDYPVTRNFEAIKSADKVVMVDGKMYVDGNISMDKGEIRRNNPTEGRDYPAITEGAKERIESYAVEVLGMDPKDVDVDFIYEMTENDVVMSMNEKGSFASNVNTNRNAKSYNVRLRETAKKGARQVAGARSKILNNPENYITPQNLSQIKSRLNQMSDGELMGEIESAKLAMLMNSQDPIAPLAAGELINREVARAEVTGNYDGVAEVYEQAAKMGTTAGRILRQLRELSSTTPKGMAASIVAAAEKRGNFLTEEQVAKVEAAAEKMLTATRKHNDLDARARAGEDVEADLKNAFDELMETKKSMGQLTNRYVGQGFGDIFTQLVQGNLLVPESHQTNVSSNMFRMFDKLFIDAIALPVQNVLDRITKGYKGVPRKYSLAAQLKGFAALGSGFKEAYRTAKSGMDPDTTSEWRMYSGLKPFTSLLDAMSGKDLPLNDKGQVNVKNRARLFIQGTLGIAPEMSFRLLGFFDTPFRRYVEAVELHHMGKERGLSGEALKRFIKHPDLKSLEKAESEGRKLTFQEDTRASRLAMQFVNTTENLIGKGLEAAFGDKVIDPKQAARVFVRTLTPYVKTPANILSETLTYISPYYAGLRIVADLREGNTKAASQNFGKAIIGSVAAEAALVLVREGLVTAAASYEDKEDEALSNLMYTNFQPESINVTGLKRWLGGGSPEAQPTDFKVQYKKLGIMGQVMGTVVNSVDKEELMARDYSGGKFLHHALRDSFGLNPLSGVAEALDQSFLQGVDGFLNVLTGLKEGGRKAETAVSDFMDSIMRSASASVLPNTLSAVNRATREFMPDRKLDRDMPVEERIATNFKYIIKDRFFGNSDVPIKVNWKGEDVPQTPEERSGFFYHLFDITNARQGASDPVSNELWRLMEITGKTSVLASTPKYASYFGGKINVPNLNQKKHKRALIRLGKDYSFLNDQDFLDSSLYFNVETLGRVMRVSGRDRLQAAEKLIASSSYQGLDDEAKLEKLDKLNDDYNSAIELDRGSFRPHSVEILNILQEIYDNEWGAEQE